MCIDVWFLLVPRKCLKCLQIHLKSLCPGLMVIIQGDLRGVFVEAVVSPFGSRCRKLLFMASGASASLGPMSREV